MINLNMGTRLVVCGKPDETEASAASIQFNAFFSTPPPFLGPAGRTRGFLVVCSWPSGGHLAASEERIVPAGSRRLNRGDKCAPFSKPALCTVSPIPNLTASLFWPTLGFYGGGCTGELGREGVDIEVYAALFGDENVQPAIF